MCRMKREELIARVRDYLRTNDKGITIYPLKERGYWRILGPIDAEGKRIPSKDIFRGSYVDAIAHAVQQKGFYEISCTDDPREGNSGIVEKVDVRELRDTGLATSLENPEEE